MVHRGLAKMFSGFNIATGTWKERWSDLYALHSERSMKMISSSIKRCDGHDDATILGLGSGVEFGEKGLESLAKTFRHMLVVDVDVETAKRTVRQMPADLRRTVEILGLDASGNVVTNFCLRADSAIEESDSLEEAIKKGVNIVRGLESQEVLAESHADFVCSSLVMTQFGSGMERYFGDRLKLRFGEYRKDDDAYVRFVLAISSLARKVNIQHIRNLDRWLRKGGSAYFADTVQELRGVSDGSQMVELTWASAPMFVVDEIYATITELFNVRASDQWVWIKKQQASSAQPTESSAYVICAYELETPSP